jgi:hypothetical protein
VDGPRSLALAAALVSLLPNPRAALPGLSYYFRDFSLTYYPLRAFFTGEAAAGRWPFWNPYLHEGSAVFPMLYPLELVQVLWPGPAFVSWLLTLHLPIAALTMYALTRALGASRWGAFAAGAAFALSGLALSALNLHWFLQALALAPLVALAFRRAALCGGRAIVLAAIVLAVAISTLAVEFAAQGLLLGLGLGLAARPRARAGARMLLAAVLGAGLAALPIALMLGIVDESLRGAGLPRELALQGTLHPLALLQLVVPDLYGSLSEPLRFWWGGRLFPGGTPYFMSLYLGPVALVLAGAGVLALAPRERRVVLGFGLTGFWYALGPLGGLSPILAPLLRWFRFPVKAMLLPVMVLALLAGFGVDRLRRGRGWKAAASVAAGLLLLVALLPAVLAVRGDAIASWLDISPRSEAAMRSTLRVECAGTALLAAALIAVALSVPRRRLEPRRASLLVAGLLVLDLSHAGMGLNPQTPTSFYEPLPGMLPQLVDSARGRVFSYGVTASPALKATLAERGPGVERASFLLSRHLLSPFANVLDRVEVAEGADRLSFIPSPLAIAPWEYDPRVVAQILPRLRSEAVSRVVSLDPLADPELRERASLPAGPPGLEIHVYDLARPWPRAFVGCRVRVAPSRSDALAAPFAPGFEPARDVVLEEAGEAGCETGHAELDVAAPGEESYEVSSDGAGYLVTRDSFTPSWQATVDGRPVRVLRESGRHRAVPIRAGRHRVTLRYAPPGWRVGLLLTALAVAASLALAARPLLQQDASRSVA